jgi:hypothetical protein
MGETLQFPVRHGLFYYNCLKTQCIYWHCLVVVRLHYQSHRPLRRGLIGAIWGNTWQDAGQITNKNLSVSGSAGAPRAYRAGALL